MTLKTKEEIQKHYQKTAVTSKYVGNRFKEPIGTLKHQKQITTINQFISKKKNPTVLDLACGPARLTRDMKGVYKGYALDTSKPMLELARKSVGTQWKVQEGDAFNLPFKKESLDVVTTFRFIRHFERNDRHKLYAEIHRILKKDGYLILDVLNKKPTNILRLIGKQNYQVYDVLYNSLYTFEQEMNNEGFHIIYARPIVHHTITQMTISKITSKIGLHALGHRAVQSLEKVGGKSPWEWITVLQKMPLLTSTKNIPVIKTKDFKKKPSPSQKSVRKK